MSCLNPHPKLSVVAPNATVNPLEPTASAGGWFARPHRIFVALLLVGVLHMFDLRFTMIEHTKGHFYELNPLAAAFLGHSLYAVVIYKLFLLGSGAAIIWHFRSHAIAEKASYLLLAACLYLGVRWQQYFELAPEQPTMFFAAAVGSP